MEKLCEDLDVKFEEKSACDFVEAVLKVKSLILENESVLMASCFSDVASVESETGGEKVESEG